jgi:hypothetical protein
VFPPASRPGPLLAYDDFLLYISDDFENDITITGVTVEAQTRSLQLVGAAAQVLFKDCSPLRIRNLRRFLPSSVRRAAL